MSGVLVFLGLISGRRPCFFRPVGLHWQMVLQIRRRLLGGKAAGGRGASKLYRVSRSDDVDVSSAQYFVNSST